MAQPPLPPRAMEQPAPAHTTSGFGANLAPPQYGPPPTRRSMDEGIDSPIHYSRDPQKLVAYLIPFPKPKLHNVPAERVPPRFLIYTPPPPPLKKPAEGEKEAKVHKVQRKWEEEIRQAKTNTAKTASWQGIKSKATKGINWGMSQTKTSNLEFLNRIGGGETPDKHADDGVVESEQTKKTVGVEEMLLVYPASMPGNSEEIKAEFVNTMLRSKSKAQRDTIIATGLLPVGFAVDILATLVWPFGGLAEIDAVWLASSFKGAKTSRNVTKRLTSSSKTGDHDKDTLHLAFTPSPRLAVLERYLAARCHEVSMQVRVETIARPCVADHVRSATASSSQASVHHQARPKSSKLLVGRHLRRAAKLPTGRTRSGRFPRSRTT